MDGLDLSKNTTTTRAPSGANHFLYVVRIEHHASHQRVERHAVLGISIQWVLVDSFAPHLPAAGPAVIISNKDKPKRSFIILLCSAQCLCLSLFAAPRKNMIPIKHYWKVTFGYRNLRTEEICIYILQSLL